jgi:hypothetical protein
VIIAVQRGDCAAAVARERRAGVKLTGGPHSDKGLSVSGPAGPGSRYRTKH